MKASTGLAFEFTAAGSGPFAKIDRMLKKL
jgi:hypothetical protein